MKLHFLGQTYSPAQSQKTITLSHVRACYRGQQYKLPLPIAKTQIDSKKLTHNLTMKKYRGVSYFSLPLNSIASAE